MVATAVCLLLIVPRVLRLAHPQIWIEDESYLTGALMLSHGFLPYRDFPLPHYPLLELLLAAALHLVHASIRTAEVTTQIAALAGSLLVFALGRRLDGPLTGAIAALVFATSGLLFRYHLFEREVFVVVPVIAAVLLASRSASAKASSERGSAKALAGRESAKASAARSGAKAPAALATAKASAPRSAKASAPRSAKALAERSSEKALAQRDGGKALAARDSIAIGALLFIALTIKLTAMAALVAVAIQLWRQRGCRAAVEAVATALGLLALLTIVLAAVFRTDFLVQVFLFRALHAEFPSLMVKLTEMRLTMDVSLACGSAGTALILWTRRTAAWAGPLLQLAAGFVVLVLFNPTYWAHTGIELLPWLSLCAGFLVASVVRAMRRPANRQQAAARVLPARAYACAIAAAGMLIVVAPLRNLNWQAGDGSTYGFGYRDRSEVEAVAADVRAHTEAQALVATPPIIAFAADRRELVPYPEIAGTIDELTDAVRRRGYIAAIGDRDLRQGSFWDAVDGSRERIAPQIALALKDRRLAAIVNDSTDDLMPLQFVNVAPDVLETDGYRLESASTHYDVWLPR